MYLALAIFKTNSLELQATNLARMEMQEVRIRMLINQAISLEELQEHPVEQLSNYRRPTPMTSSTGSRLISQLTQTERRGESNCFFASTRMALVESVLINSSRVSLMLLVEALMF